MLFARYAFGPTGWACADRRTGVRCWSWARPRARRQAQALEIDHGLRDLAAGFEGAYPYLELIASAHGIADPMDLRVVDAYWIGNTLSDGVDPVLMTQSIDTRFRAQLLPEAWKWLEGKPEAGARPTHAFHVFDIFPRVGLMRGGAVTDAVGLMDSCRIRWGRVLEVTGESLVVNAVPLGLEDGKLALGEPRTQTVRRWLDGDGLRGRRRGWRCGLAALGLGLRGAEPGAPRGAAAAHPAQPRPGQPDHLGAAQRAGGRVPPAGRATTPATQARVEPGAGTSPPGGGPGGLRLSGRSDDATPLLLVR